MSHLRVVHRIVVCSEGIINRAAVTMVGVGVIILPAANLRLVIIRGGATKVTRMRLLEVSTTAGVNRLIAGGSGGPGGGRTHDRRIISSRYGRRLAYLSHFSGRHAL